MKDKNIVDPFYMQIQREIDRIERKADVYTFFFYFIRIMQILFAGMITVVTGMGTFEGERKDIVLVLSTIVTAVTAADTLYQVEGKKNNYKLLLFELRSIRAEFVFNDTLKTGKVELKNALYDRYKKASNYARDLIATDTSE